MLLYRGLSKPYRPELVGAAQGPIFGTDFTDCPLAALSFARGSRGVVLVLNIPDTGPKAKVSEELWQPSGPRRLMVWGSFDRHIAAIIPAKELRARIRVKGIAGTPDQYKADILRTFIEQWMEAKRAGFGLEPGWKPVPEDHIIGGRGGSRISNPKTREDK